MSLPYADILILALVAGFILLRLRSILGEDAGMDPPSNNTPANHDRFAEDAAEDGNVLPLYSRPQSTEQIKEEAADKALLDALDENQRDAVAEIKKIEPDFDLNRFITGAKAAFEMVLQAFHENDKDTLKHLLADDIEDLFVEEAEKNQHGDTQTHTTLVSIPEVTILDVDLTRKHATISVRFVSEQITVERDKEGKMVSGDPSAVHRIEDEWSFERDLGAKHPNWTITST